MPILLPVQDAGSAEQFKKVDLHHVQLGAQAAKQAGAQQFSLCTVRGANANLWASNLSPLHFLLYAKTKGQVSCTHSMYGSRPGIMDNGGSAHVLSHMAHGVVVDAGHISGHKVQKRLRQRQQELHVHKSQVVHSS